VDIGSVKWDFSPRKYQSKGIFTFDGVDIVNYIQDSTLSVKDTLLNLIQVKSSTEQYTTSINSRFLLGGSYIMDTWSFEALYQLQRRFGQNSHQLSLSAFKKISFLDVGLLYTLKRNDLANLGIYAGIKVKPIQLYISANNIVRLFSYEKATGAGLVTGLTMKF
jgi:hypothetical protein